MTLSELPVGCDAVVIDVDDSCPAGHRLRDIGLLPKTRVRALRRAPLGDPTVYEFRGMQLCLRRREAGNVRVALSKSEADGESRDG